MKGPLAPDAAPAIRQTSVCTGIGHSGGKYTVIALESEGELSFSEAALSPGLVSVYPVFV